MPNYESTAVFRADISSLKKEMQAAARAAKLADAEFKAATAGMDDWSSTSDGLTAKLKQLDAVLASQKSKYEMQKRVLQETEAAYGKNSAAADRERMALLNMEAAVKRTEADIQRYQSTLQQVEQAETEAAEGVKKYESATEELTDKIGDQESQLEALKNAYKDALLDGNTESAEEYGAEIESLSSELAENRRKMQQAEKAADALDHSMDDLDDSTSEATDGFTTLKGAVASFIGNMAAKGAQMALEGLKKAFTETVRVGSDFEAAMSKVSALSGATGSDLDKMAAKAKELGATTQFSATQVAEGFQYMSLAGWDANTSLEAIDGVLKLAASAEMDLASASDMVTDYLSAFGMEASRAGEMADMLAYAQANSNTTATQLGEAYGNSAAGLHAAGQEIETVTAILEGLANQGLKGSEAGTALNGVMSQITQKMADGAIQIGDTSIAVQDQEGNFRDLLDILADVETATDGMGTAEKSAALAAVFNRTSLSGLNLILNEGVDNIKDYRDALEDSTGAASDMSDTMNDNLKGDLKAFGSALEGIGITAYDAIDGPIRGAVQLATDAISKLNDAIKPTESSLKSFASEVRESVSATEKTLEAARQTVSDAEVSAGKLDMYKQILIESNGAADEFAKFQMKQIVDELADTVPELAAAWDEESGSLKLTNEEIARFIDNSAEMMKAQAYQKAAQQATDALVQAQIDQVKAQSAVNKAEKEYIDSSGEWEGANNMHRTESREAAEALREATKAQEEADQALSDAQTEYDLTTEALKGYQGTLDDITEAEARTEEQTRETGDAMEESLDPEVFEELQKAADQMYDSVRQAMKGSISAFEEFNGGTEVTADEIIKNLDSQIAGVRNWADNMKKLGALAGSGMSQELYDYLVEMGPQSANLVQELVDTLENDEPKFREISDKWGEAVKLSNQESVLIGDATSTGKAAAEAAGEGIEDGKKEPIKQAGELSAGVKKKLDELSPAARTAGVKAGESNAAGISSTSGKAKSAGTTVATSGVSGMGSQTGAAKSKGSSTGSSFVSGVSAHSSSSRSAGTNLATSATSGMNSSSAQSSATSAGNTLGQRFYNAIKSWASKAKNLLKDDGGGGSRTNPSGNTSGTGASGAARTMPMNPTVYFPGYHGPSGGNTAQAQAQQQSNKYAYEYGVNFSASWVKGMASQENQLKKTVSGMVVNVVDIMRKSSIPMLEEAGDKAATVFSDAMEKRIDYMQKRMSYESDQQIESIEKEIAKLQDELDKAQDNVSGTESTIKTLESSLKTAKSNSKKYNKIQKSINKLLKGTSKKKLNAEIKKLESDKKLTDKEKARLKSLKNTARELTSLQKQAKKYADAGSDVIKITSKLSKQNSILKTQQSTVAQWEDLIEKQEDFKAKYEKSSAETMDAFQNALSNYEESANNLIESTIDGISDKYTARYDDLIEKQQDLINKLKASGDLFSISGAGVMTVNDIKAQTKAITDYTSKLQKIKAKVSAELFDEISAFDVKEGSAYLDRLLAMSAKDLSAYNKAYTEKMAAAEKAGDLIYKRDIEKVSKDYESEINKAFKNLPARLKNLGNEAMKSFVDGIGADTDYLNNGIKTLINGMIDQFRKDLDMHSPSRVMAGLADNTMEGYADQMKEWLSKIRSTASEMANTISAPFAPDLSGYGSLANQIGGAGSRTSIVNNYNLTQNNTSPRPLTALQTYQARRQQIDMIKAVTGA